MATTIKFTKMQGTGNDYIYVNTFVFSAARSDKSRQKMERLSYRYRCRRSGTDWSIRKSGFQYAYIQCRRLRSHDVWKRPRCIGKYVYEKGLTDKEVITLETLSGIKILKLHTGNGW